MGRAYFGDEPGGCGRLAEVNSVPVYALFA
jgi:hypothetical protein